MGKKTRTEWRKFELAVSQLEALLVPAGYALKSPDWLLDRDTGELREVDCSITHPTRGDTVSLECRKRGKKQDVLWIEQLVCKKDSLGLAGTVAVSSKGFSRAAQVKALKRGIVLKTFREVTEPTFLADTAHGLQILHLVPRGTVRSGTVTFETDDDEPEVSASQLASMVAAIAAAPNATALLRDSITGQELTLPKLVQVCLGRLTELPVGRHSKKCRLEFPPKTTIMVPLGVFVRALQFVLDVEVATKPMSRPTLFAYEGNSHAPLQVAAADVQTVDGAIARLEVVFTTEAHGVDASIDQ
jgi:hypothetical protein